MALSAISVLSHAPITLGGSDEPQHRMSVRLRPSGPPPRHLPVHRGTGAERGIEPVHHQADPCSRVPPVLRGRPPRTLGRRRPAPAPGQRLKLLVGGLRPVQPLTRPHRRRRVSSPGEDHHDRATQQATFGPTTLFVHSGLARSRRTLHCGGQRTIRTDPTDCSPQPPPRTRNHGDSDPEVCRAYCRHTSWKDVTSSGDGRVVVHG
jgi:hypothetical protein